MRPARLGLPCASIVAAALIGLLGVRLWPRRAPHGQPPLTQLSSVEPIRDMPVILTDVAAPSSGKLALARQHADRLSPDERNLLDGAPVAWDLVATFPPGATWTSDMPWTSSWGFPVVDAVDELAARLRAG